MVEGNYLCLNEPPWTQLADLWDLTVYLDVPEPVLTARLIERWTDLGLTKADALTKAELNDLPNARRVASGLSDVDLHLRMQS